MRSALLLLALLVVLAAGPALASALLASLF